MKTCYWGLLLVGALFYTVSCKPTSEDDEQDYLLNDGEDYGDDYQSKGEEDPNKNDDDLGDNDLDLPVKIETKPLMIVKNINETVILPCNITGGSSTLVQFWRKNEVPIFQAGIKMGDAHQNMQQDSDGSLRIWNIKPDDSGDYKCEVITDGDLSVTHVLYVNTPPKIRQIYAKNNLTKLNVGDTLILTCIASGYPKPHISWHKGGERLGDEGETLTITNVKHRDAGSYRCLADNKVGKPAYEQIEIKIDYKPVVEIEKIFVSSDTKHDAELKCIVHAEPKPSVVWKLNGKNIINTEHTQLSHNGHHHILLIKDLEESDFGIYTCYAANSVGVRERNVSLVKTPAILEFIKPQKNVKDVVLTWKVESKSPISEHQLQYRKKGTDDWTTVNPEITDDENGVYMVKYTLKGLDVGVYETRLRSQNNHGWSDYSEIMPFEGVYAKQGKHKKGRKEMKEKNTKTLQETTPIEPEIPAEHTENDSAIGASQTSGSSIISSSLSLLSLVGLLCFRQ